MIVGLYIFWTICFVALGFWAGYLLGRSKGYKAWMQRYMRDLAIYGTALTDENGNFIDHYKFFKEPTK